MGLDIHDFTDLIPFIIAHPSETVYLIIFCFIVGFICGNVVCRVIANFGTKSKKKLQEEVQQLKDELDNYRHNQPLSNALLTPSAIEQILSSSSSEKHIEVKSYIKIKIDDGFPKT